MIELRAHQSAGIDEIRAHLKAGTRAVLWQLPTGGGKTLGAAHMIGGAVARGHRAWFVCHRRELLRQSSQAFLKMDIAHSLVGADEHMNPRAKVQICGIATLKNRIKRLPPPKLIVWDECHHMAAKSWGDVFAAFPDSMHVGLSATPQRLDGKGLSKYFQAMVLGPSTSDLINQGFLSPYRLFAPEPPDMSGVHKTAGDYNRGEVAGVMDKPAIIGSAVAHYRSVADGRKAVVFCASIEASQHTAAEFCAAGYRFVHVDGNTDAGLRDNIMRDFNSGLLDGLTNVDLFGEGVDVGDVSCVIQMRPTQSLALHLQQIGRGLRTAPGKTDCIILDHAGNYFRHGLPDQEREWSLDGHAERVGKAATVANGRRCGACFAISGPGAQKCKECGTKFEVVAREVEVRDGTLAEIDVAAARQKTPEQVERLKEQADARSLESLVALGTARGMKNPTGWALHLLAARENKRKGKAA